MKQKYIVGGKEYWATSGTQALFMHRALLNCKHPDKMEDAPRLARTQPHYPMEAADDEYYNEEPS